MLRLRSVVSLLLSALGACSLVLPSSAYAQTYNASGTISQMYHAEAWMSIRVNLQQNGAAQMTSCPWQFGYLSTSDDNYQAMMATLELAFATRKGVTLYYTVDSSSYCHIYDLSVQY